MEENPAKSAKWAHNDQPRRSTITTTLPDNLVMEQILPRLPVKSLFRVKCTSKYWYFIISKSRDFAKIYLKFSSLSRRHFFGMNPSSEGKSYKFFLLPYQECSDNSDMVELGDGDVVDKTRIVDSCNGLVCLYCQKDDEDWDKEEWERECYFMLWNPATRQSRIIESPPGVHFASSYGFGYVPSLDDYKIVASFQTEFEEVWTFRGLYVFSLRWGEWERLLTGRSEYSSKYGGSWRKIRDRSKEEVIEEEIANELKGGGLVIGDTLYWPPTEYNPIETIAGFDLVNDKFVEHAFRVKQDEYYEKVELFRLKGCLGLCGDYGGHHGFSFWMLKDVNNWNSWQKLFSVDQTKVSFLTISETGKCLAQISNQLELVDFSKEALRRCELTTSPLIERVVDHFDSHVSPFELTNEETENFETAGHSNTDSQLPQNKRHCPSQFCKVNEVGLENDGMKDCSDEDDDGEDDEDSDEFEQLSYFSGSFESDDEENLEDDSELNSDLDDDY